jgi:hypothetical protein
MLVSEATLPRAERLLTHLLLESVLPHPLIRPKSDESSVESDETDDATVVEHIEDDAMANFEQSNSYSSSASGHILPVWDGSAGKESGGGGRLQLEEDESFINCCNRKAMSREEFIVIDK